ncbi:MAG: hypothetical protein EXS38_02315 [Opitutus sp.]|nr:hypothetical protein [Opitutus sp.]
MPVAQLADWRWSSYRWLRDKACRPTWLQVATALAEAGGLADHRARWETYDQFLTWQAENGQAGKVKAYVAMSQGWALGSKEFRASLVREFDLAASSRAWEGEG